MSEEEKWCVTEQRRIYASWDEELLNVRTKKTLSNNQIVTIKKYFLDDSFKAHAWWNFYGVQKVMS